MDSIDEFFRVILNPLFLRYVLIGGGLGGFLVSLTCWLLWRWKPRDPRSGVDQAKAIGKLSGYNTFVLGTIAVYFALRYLVLDVSPGTNSDGLLQIGVVIVYALIIIGLCLPGLVSLISGGGRRTK